MSQENGYKWAGYREETSHVVQLATSLIFIYSLFIDALNRLVLFVNVFSGNPDNYKKADIPELVPILPSIIQFPPNFPFPDPYVLIIVRCFIIVIVTYYISYWICHMEWVPVLVKNGCYDNTALKCGYIYVLKYYLRIVCTRVFRIIVIIVGIICIATGLLAVYLI